MCDIPIEIVAIVKSWMTQWENVPFPLTNDPAIKPYFDAAKKFVEENTPNAERD